MCLVHIVWYSRAFKGCLFVCVFVSDKALLCAMPQDFLSLFVVYSEVESAVGTESDREAECSVIWVRDFEQGCGCLVFWSLPGLGSVSSHIVSVNITSFCNCVYP